MPLSPTKSDDWNVLLLIYNHFLEQNFFDKLIKKYFYKQNKTLSSIYLFRSTTGSLKNRTALLSLGDFICKGLLKATSLVTIDTWFNFFLETIFYLHQILMPSPRLVFPFIRACTYFWEISRYKNDGCHLSFYTELKHNSAKPKFFWGVAKRYLVVIVILPSPCNAYFLPPLYLLSPCWRLKGKNVFISLFREVGKRERDF